jgi:opacity protein-like surface antigen
MKLVFAGLAAVLALSGVASAQTTSEDETGYVQFVGQSAFGNVTSQSFGAEGGVKLKPNLSVFAEFGRVRDSAPSSIGPAAQVIASYLGATQSGKVQFSVRQPIFFGDIGIKYSFALTNEKLHPYVMAGGGMARVQRDVKFTIDGNDVTDKLGNYGVTLGSDLAGDLDKPMFVAGGGVVYTVGEKLQFDAGYRFNGIMTEGTRTNVNRVGLGIGFRF